MKNGINNVHYNVSYYYVKKFYQLHPIASLKWWMLFEHL